MRCRAHRTKEQVKKLDTQGKFDVAGNTVPDRWAKEGANLDRGFGREMAIQAEITKGGASGHHDFGEARLGGQQLE